MTEHEIVVAVRARLDLEEQAGVPRTIDNPTILAALAGIVVGAGQRTKAHTRDDAPQGVIPTDNDDSAATKRTVRRGRL